MAETAESTWVWLRPEMRVGPEVEDGRGHCVYVQDTASRRMYRFDAQTGGFLRRAYAPEGSPVPLSSAIASLTRNGDDAARGAHALTTLRELGIVEVDDTGPGGTAREKRAERLHLFDPSAVLAPVVRHLGWVLGPIGLVLAVLALALVLGVVLLDTDDVVRSAVTDVGRWPWTVPVTVVVALGHLVMHQLAHGAAVIRWGGRCRSFALVTRPLPGLRSDVSDVGALSGRLRRGGVFLAGIGTSWAVAAVLLAAWMVVPHPGALASMLAGAGLLSAVLALLSTLPWPGSDSARAWAQLRGRVG